MARLRVRGRGKHMDVIDTMAAAHTHPLPTGVVNPADVVTALTLFPSLVLFAAACTGVGLGIFFIVSLSDLSEDLINPYTFETRINPKLKFELAAHGVGVAVLLLGWNKWALLLAVPSLVLRIYWHASKQLDVDATTCFNDSTQSKLRHRWGLMSVWHGLALVYAFIQLVLHAALAVARTVPMDKVAKLAHPLQGNMNSFAAAAMHNL